MRTQGAHLSVLKKAELVLYIYVLCSIGTVSVFWHMRQLLRTFVIIFKLKELKGPKIDLEPKRKLWLRSGLVKAKAFVQAQ